MHFKKTALSMSAHTAVFLFFFGALAFPAYAADPAPITPEQTGYKEAARFGGFVTELPAGADALTTYISYILKGLFGVLGVIFLALMIYGGLRWMMSQGNTTEVDAARNTLVNATIGLVVVVASYAVTNFVIYSLINNTTILQ